MALAHRGPPNEPIHSRGHGKPIQANKKTTKGQAPSLKSDEGNITHASTRKKLVKENINPRKMAHRGLTLIQLQNTVIRHSDMPILDSNDHHGLAYSIVSHIFAPSLTKPVENKSDTEG